MPTELLFVLLALLWGPSFLLIKVSLDSFNPAQVGLLRLALGTVTLSVILAVTKRPWPRGRSQLLHGAAVAVLLFVIPVALYSWAGQFIASSLSAILNATTPLMTLLVTTVALRDERLRPTQAAGILLGGLGILLVIAPWDGAAAAPAASGGGIAWLAIAACLGSTLSYGAAYTWMRKFLIPKVATGTSYDPLSLTALQLTIATVLTAAVSPWSGVFTSSPSFEVWPVVSLLALGILVTGIGYVWNTTITASWGPIRASQVTYVTPIVGIAVGALILSEPVSWYQLAGTAAVLLGISITRRSRPLLPQPMVASPAVLDTAADTSSTRISTGG